MNTSSQRHSDIATLYVKWVAMAGLGFAIYLAVVKDTESRTASILNRDANNAPASEKTKIFNYTKPQTPTGQLDFIKGMYGTNKTSPFPGVLPDKFEGDIPLNPSPAPDTALHTTHYNSGPAKEHIDKNYGIHTIHIKEPVSPE